MGLGPPIIALYRQLKTLGLFDHIKHVAELGSQNVWCPQRTMMRDLYRAFGREAPPDAIIESFANWTGSARDFHEHLGMTYACIDVDARFGSLTLDMNFDEVPIDHRDRYDLTTNHGTSEHIMNQHNVFKMMHDLTRPGGLILHAVPFTVHLEHGFFNYHTEFFDALAAANAYRTLGIWIGPDWQLGSLVPWHPSLLEHLTLSAKTTHLLVVMHQKTTSREFRAPVPGATGERDRAWWTSPYCHAVDVELYDGTRDRFVVAGPRLPLLGPPQALPDPFAPDASADAHHAVARLPRRPPVLGAPLMMLYRQLKTLGVLDGVRSVVELGAPRLDAPVELVDDVLRAFGRTPAGRSGAADADRRARDLYEALGLTCASVDPEGGPGVVKLDLECEGIPPELLGRHDLAANVETGATMLNQLNVFRCVHDLVRPGGLMLHVVPFKIPPRHALIGYQPNFFEALARYNSYRTLGTWIAVDAKAPGLIPWQATVLDYLDFSERSEHALVVLLQKMYANEFCVPFQGVYEPMVPATSLARYRMVIEGMYSDGAAALAMGKAPGAPAPPPAALAMGPTPEERFNSVPARDLLRELRRRVGLRLAELGAGRVRRAFMRPAPASRRPPAT